MGVDPPQQNGFRRLVQSGFTPRTTAAVEAFVREKAAEVVERKRVTVTGDKHEYAADAQPDDVAMRPYDGTPPSRTGFAPQSWVT